jgi:hypothetical protein
MTKSGEEEKDYGDPPWKKKRIPKRLRCFLHYLTRGRGSAMTLKPR